VSVAQIVDLRALDRLPERIAEPPPFEGWEPGAAAPPEPLPSTWRVLFTRDDGAAYERTGLRVIVSAARELDGRRWLHVSCSRRSRVPSYDEMLVVRNLFIGDREAIQVFPPRARHVSIHRYCLHLWCCLDGPVLPDFARGGDSI
jgi:hypothetical protein